MTSHDVVSHVRRTLHEKRVGHAGTLDPLAVAFDSGCRVLKRPALLTLAEKCCGQPFRLGGNRDR